MKPNIRVEEYQVAADSVSIGGIRWLAKWGVNIEFSDRDTAYAWKDRIEKLLTGKLALRESIACPECGMANPVMECDCGHRWEAES